MRVDTHPVCGNTTIFVLGSRIWCCESVSPVSTVGAWRSVPLYQSYNTLLSHNLLAVATMVPDARVVTPTVDASVSIVDATQIPDAVSVDAALVFDAAPTEFNAAFCTQVEGTLNIHWEAVGGGSAPCTGIETTDGVVADASANGAVVMSGVSVSNDQCIGVAAYNLVLSNDMLSLTGSDTLSKISMTLTRQAGEACFVGHWISGADDYVGHISAEAFGISLN